MKNKLNVFVMLVLFGFSAQAIACTLYGVGATTCDCGTFTCSVPDGDVNGDVACGQAYDSDSHTCITQDGSCCAKDFQETTKGTPKPV